LHITHAEELKV